MSRFASAMLAALLAFIIYLVLSAGTANPKSTILLWSLPELIIGLVLSLIVGFLCRKFVPTSAARILNPKRWLVLIVYLFPFLFELIVANCKVAWSVITGKNIKPAIRKVEKPVDTDFGLLMLTSTITYQPGTVVVDADDDDKSVYVHFLDGGEKPEKTVEPKKVFSIINLIAWIRRITQ